MRRSMEIRCKDEATKRVLDAAAEGDLETLSQLSPAVVQKARCSSGCSPLHWAAGANQLAVIEDLITTGLFHVDAPATRKAGGRTPLHYACRNGCLDAAQLLVKLGADVNARAKHGVSPFQLSVWQNHMSLCVWLVNEHGVNPEQVNDFECGAIHWLGICPFDRANFYDHEIGEGQDLIPLAKWLATQPSVNYSRLQRQGHSALHKAAWGGHIALIRYLRDEHGLMDDRQDDAGNFAADLADMANTIRHTNVAKFLRQECSPARAKSCSILGVTMNASPNEIRKAYLAKARVYHPDRQYVGQSAEQKVDLQSDKGIVTDQTNGNCDLEFSTLRRAYEHLQFENGIGSQSNPAHSLNLMLDLNSSSEASTLQTTNHDSDDLFKARLVAVLLEYGDKGLALCNIKKKWLQVWPGTPFPPDVFTQKTKKKGFLANYIVQHAGDVVELQYPNDQTGNARVVPIRCTQEMVSKASQRPPPVS